MCTGRKDLPRKGEGALQYEFSTAWGDVCLKLLEELPKKEEVWTTMTTPRTCFFFGF
jgi:hypothetical protein